MKVKTEPQIQGHCKENSWALPAVSNFYPRPPGDSLKIGWEWHVEKKHSIIGWKFNRFHVSGIQILPCIYIYDESDDQPDQGIPCIIQILPWKRSKCTWRKAPGTEGAEARLDAMDVFFTGDAERLWFTRIRLAICWRTSHLFLFRASSVSGEMFNMQHFNTFYIFNSSDIATRKESLWK